MIEEQGFVFSCAGASVRIAEYVVTKIPAMDRKSGKELLLGGSGCEAVNI